MAPVALALISYMVLLATLAPRMLASARWPGRMPRVALLMWQAAGVSVLAAFVATTLLLSLAARGLWRGVEDFARICMHLVRATYCPTSVPGIVGPIAFAILLGVAAWGIGLAVRQRWITGRWRRGHRRGLDLLTTDADGVTVVSHPVPLVYTVPGRHARIVMTTASTERLTGEQRAAALAHEHAHLTGHHDLLVGFARLLERAFPGVPLFRTARQQTCRLVEMIADDRAVARYGSTALLGAIATVAVTPPQAGVLAVSGADSVERVSRLLAPAPAPVSWRATAFAVAVLLPTLPVLAVVLPIAATVGLPL